MGVTFRSIILGLVLIPLNCMWLAQCEIMWYSGQPTTISLFTHVAFMLFLLALANLLVRRIRPAWAFTPPELLVVYSMLAIASALSGHDMIEILLPTLAHLHRYAPLEGRYVEIMKTIHDHIPEWIMVTDTHALESFYIGQESVYDPANFMPWLRPLAWWFCFIMALCMVLWGLVLLFRKQWTENEKLAYPVIQVPMLLAEETDTLLRNRLFISAFALAALVDLVNGLNVLYPLMPKIPVVQATNLRLFFTQMPWVAMGDVWVSFYPFAIGMCFFMPLDLAFSSWFFFFFWKAQRVLAAHIGVHGMPGFPFVEEQTAGGYYAIALVALWISRHHLWRVGRILLNKPVDRQTSWDRKEAWMSVALVVAGSALLYTFCTIMGMTWYVILIFFGMYFLISIAITRMRAELGPPAHDLHAIGPNFQIMRIFGATEMGKGHIGSPVDLVLFGFLNFFNRAYRGHPMPHAMEAFRIAERYRMSRMRYLIAMAVAIVAGTVSAFWALLYVFDKYGAAAQVIGPGEIFGREIWETHVNTWFTAPPPYLKAQGLAIVIGLVFSLVLAVLRLNLPWWPFHPVGYAVSGSWSMDMLWMSILTAWLIKLLLMKYGGVKAYKTAIPFFVGLIMGDFVVGSLWNLYGIMMGVQVYHFWPY